LRDERDERRESEHHVARVSMLALGAVHAAADLELSEPGRLEAHDARADRAEGVEPLRAGPLLLAALDVPGGDVVHAGDPRECGERLGFGRPPDPAADHHADLGLVIDPGRFGRQHDGVAVADHGGGRLEEDQRLLGNHVSELRRVLAVVPSDGDDFSRPRDGHRAAPSRLGRSCKRVAKSAGAPEAAP